MLAPASNPLNVSSIIAAKQDKPVTWVKTCDLPLEKVLHIAMKHSAKKRKREGTRNAQTKRRFLAKKVERDALIQKTEENENRTPAAVRTENKVCEKQIMYKCAKGLLSYKNKIV